MLCRLIYASDVATPFDFGDVQAILAKAQQNNPALDITGLLVMVSQRFLQVMEGPSENVNLLYRKISRDSRHGNCSLVEFGPVPHPPFRCLVHAGDPHGPHESAAEDIAREQVWNR
jgi:hypothetical protein